MKESKIVQYIFSFSPKEREKFDLFIKSPFYNQHKKTQQLYTIIKSQADKKKPKLEKEVVFNKLFPNETFQEQKIYDLLSNLKKLLNRYLAAIYLEDHPQMTELFTLETTYKTRRFDLLKNRAKQLDKHLQAKTSQNDNHYYIKYRMQNLLGYYGGTYVNRAKSDTLQGMMDSLDRFYILEKLKNSCQLYAHHILMNTSYEWNLLDQILAFLNQNWDQFKDDISINLYFTILMSLRESENDSHYQKLKNMVTDQIDLLATLEKEDLYSFTTNYCIRQINRGLSKFQLELFELYQQGLATGVIYQNGILTEWNYKNIATLGAKLQKFDWTEWFINANKDKLPATQRENAYSYNLAYLYYTKGNYSEVLSNLLHVQYTDVKYHLNSSYLLLRTYYQMEDTEALLSLIDTFRIYVLRNRQMNADQKKEWINFLRLAKRLVILKHHYHSYSRSELPSKMEALKTKIKETDQVMNRSWLLEECQV